jgi:hypothetical protein
MGRVGLSEPRRVVGGGTPWTESCRRAIREVRKDNSRSECVEGTETTNRGKEEVPDKEPGTATSSITSDRHLTMRSVPQAALTV